MRDRFPTFTKSQIRAFVEQFNLKPKQYYRLNEKEEEEKDEENEDNDLPPGWRRGIDEESGRV